MFTYKHYIDTCKKYKENNYSFCLPDTSVSLTSKQIYMFHDIDVRIENAENLAKIEYENNIQSTYFIRIGASCYNVFNPYYSSIIKRIKAMNHEIGYHYEKIFNNKNEKEEINDMIKILSNFLEFDIKYFNIHEPSRTGIDLSSLKMKENRCYNSLFFNDAKYISDSGGRWREGCFSTHINAHKNLLVLTHPFLWYKNTPRENY